jgi:hypothetical protein
MTLDTRKFSPRRNRSRSSLTTGIGATLLAIAASVALIAATPASANNDPHRIYLAAAPFDLPASLCGFPVHVEPLVDREYATMRTNPDGSTTYKVTGSLFVSLTNTTTGKTITANVSGPASSTFSADGTTLTFAGNGLSLVWATNLVDFGAPSNLVVTAGPTTATILFTTNPVAGSIVGPAQVGHVLIDVCAALSP